MDPIGSINKSTFDLPRNKPQMELSSFWCLSSPWIKSPFFMSAIHKLCLFFLCLFVFHGRSLNVMSRYHRRRRANECSHQSMCLLKMPTPSTKLNSSKRMFINFSHLRSPSNQQYDSRIWNGVVQCCARPVYVNFQYNGTGTGASSSHISIINFSIENQTPYCQAHAQPSATIIRLTRVKEKFGRNKWRKRWLWARWNCVECVALAAITI